jgi:hypothetical protein
MKASFSFEELTKSYEGKTAVIRCECELATEIVGGVPASADGLRAFAKHHLGIVSEKELDEAVERMQKEEIGERDVTPELGELSEKMKYGINVIRRDENGPWIGDWMVKAHYKQAASRLKIFVEYRGSKGDFAEAGRVKAVGISLVDQNHPERIYLRDESGKRLAKTYFREFRGRVQTPQGPMSIIQNSECCAPGTRFAFEYRVLPGALKISDLKDVVAMGMTVGLGSAKALECGKYRVLKCDIEVPGAKEEKKAKAAAA